MFNSICSMKANQYHTYPDSIKKEIELALDYFPQLENVTITFKFKSDIKKSTMQAQPDFKSLLTPMKKRKYYIFISEKFKISGKEFKTVNIPSEIITGWIGHELGHILDYQERGTFNLVWFGIKYLYLENHIIDAERSADTFAVNQGMEDYILKTKNFILNHADIDPDYKKRIKQYYLSPEEIMQIVQDR
ncbi:hypothetical protein pgond44_07050 [Psychroflexus gondwanensis ACAM 44]|uniref:Uncharacterized protein n=1 Tax=Psychroflexus gondwanensis ACAM 44 TaxID=1189619 RepID=N1WWT3_9FLAO|nr:hypothetical protein [Psychroflexus gondwanensis]EMY81589.1 hypothetical protein pgond44_07050 [Psychroflexus gondwanensis ACAM 44]